MDNIKELSISELDAALSEVQQLRRTSLRTNVPPDNIVALENTAMRLMNELRRRGL